MSALTTTKMSIKLLKILQTDATTSVQDTENVSQKFSSKQRHKYCIQKFHIETEEIFVLEQQGFREESYREKYKWARTFSI